MADISEMILIVKESTSRIANLANEIRENPTTIDELKPITVISPPLKDALEHWEKFFETEAPPLECKVMSRIGVKINEKYEVFDLITSKRLTVAWRDGEMRVNKPAGSSEWHRVSVLMAAFYGIKKSNSDYVIGYKNGDRRDMSSTNLEWIPNPGKLNYTNLLVEDICRRIIEYDGDVNTILSKYKNSSPKVTEEYIRTILNKEAGRSISDRFFKLVNGRVEKVESVNDSSTSNGMDIYQVFMMTHGDMSLVDEIFKTKCDGNFIISQTEFEMLYAIVDDDNPHDPQWYVDKIKGRYGKTIPVDVIKSINKESKIIEEIKTAKRR